VFKIPNKSDQSSANIDSTPIPPVNTPVSPSFSSSKPASLSVDPSLINSLNNTNPLFKRRVHEEDVVISLLPSPSNKKKPSSSALSSSTDNNSLLKGSQLASDQHLEDEKHADQLSLSSSADEKDTISDSDMDDDENGVGFDFDDVDPSSMSAPGPTSGSVTVEGQASTNSNLSLPRSRSRDPSKKSGKKSGSKKSAAEQEAEMNRVLVHLKCEVCDKKKAFVVCRDAKCDGGGGNKRFCVDCNKLYRYALISASTHS
jgi:hypothetical protein